MSKSIHIEIRLYGSFRIGRFKKEARQLPAGTLVRHVIEELALPEGQVGIVVVNDRHSDQEYLLQDGDTLSLFPFVAGG